MIPTVDFNYEGSPTAKDRLEDSPTAAVHEIVNSWPIVNGADAMGNKENEGIVVAKSIWTAAGSNEEGVFVKPPASARFGHRRNTKFSPEGSTLCFMNFIRFSFFLAKDATIR